MGRPHGTQSPTMAVVLAAFVAAVGGCGNSKTAAKPDPRIAAGIAALRQATASAGFNDHLLSAAQSLAKDPKETDLRQLEPTLATYENVAQKLIVSGDQLSTNAPGRNALADVARKHRAVANRLTKLAQDLRQDARGLAQARELDVKAVRKLGTLHSRLAGEKKELGPVRERLLSGLVSLDQAVVEIRDLLSASRMVTAKQQAEINEIHNNLETNRKRSLATTDTLRTLLERRQAAVDQLDRSLVTGPASCGIFQTRPGSGGSAKATVFAGVITCQKAISVLKASARSGSQSARVGSPSGGDALRDTEAFGPQPRA